MKGGKGGMKEAERREDREVGRRGEGGIMRERGGNGSGGRKTQVFIFLLCQEEDLYFYSKAYVDQKEADNRPELSIPLTGTARTSRKVGPFRQK